MNNKDYETIWHGDDEFDLDYCEQDFTPTREYPITPSFSEFRTCTGCAGYGYIEFVPEERVPCLECNGMAAVAREVDGE